MEPKWWCNQTPTAYSMTLPCPHLDQLERSEDHVNSWHRPRRWENSPGFGPKHKHFATAAIFDTAGKPHTAGRTFGVPISRITYARRRRGPRTRWSTILQDYHCRRQLKIPHLEPPADPRRWRPPDEQPKTRRRSVDWSRDCLPRATPPSRSTPTVPDAAVDPREVHHLSPAPTPTPEPPRADS